MKQTAVEFLEEKIKDIFYVAEASEMNKMFEIFYQQAKEMEKQQIIDACTYGNRQEFYDAEETMGEQYYNETFKNK